MLRCERRAACTAEPSLSRDAPSCLRCQEPSVSPANSCQESFNDLQVKLNRRKEKKVCWSVNRAKAVSVTSFHQWPCSVRPHWGGWGATCIPAHGSHPLQKPASMSVLLAVAVLPKAAHAPSQDALPVPCPSPAQPLQVGWGLELLPGWDLFLSMEIRKWILV